MLRISTVVDTADSTPQYRPLEVLRISTVVDSSVSVEAVLPLEVLRISTVVDRRIIGFELPLWKC